MQWVLFVLAAGLIGCTLDRMGTGAINQKDGGNTGGKGGEGGSAGVAGSGAAAGEAGSAGGGGATSSGGAAGAGGEAGTGGVAGAGGEADAGGDAGAGGAGGDAGPVVPPPPAADYYTDAPCPFPASLSYEASSNTLLMACGAPNALFRSPPLGQQGSWTKVGDANGYPSNHIWLNDKYYLVTHSSPDGFTIINGKTGQITVGVNFASINPLNPLFTQIKSTINNPAGALLAGGKICVATSNLNQIDPNDPSKTTFHLGSVICTPYNYDGTVSIAMTTAQLTAGINPTGMALIDKDPINGGTKQRFAVLSSNTYGSPPPDGGVNTAMIEICDAFSDSGCTPISLGNITAQVAPMITMTEDGSSFLIGMQRPNNGFFAVKWDGGAISYPQTPLQVNNFVYGANVFGKLALITDAGVYGDPLKSGALKIHNMDPNGWQGTLTTPLPGMAGPSVVVNDADYAAVTVKAGNDPAGQIYKVKVSGL